jgi:HD-GYP domain-containing protein (c-di-GMP phosphodiesterase class II)
MENFFSINLTFLPLGKNLTVDLYVNSGKQKFFKIFKKEDSLDRAFLQHIIDKYHQVYVSESDRNSYLALLGDSEASEDEKFQVVREGAITYLNQIFQSGVDGLADNLGQSKEVIKGISSFIEGKSLDDIKALMAKLSFHDFYTFDHSINVCMYSLTFYKGITEDYSEDDIFTLGVGTLLHDLGKLKVPTSIINKPSHLSEEEFKKIKAHPLEGLHLLEEIQSSLPDDIDWEKVKLIIAQHHEHFDGSGYPLALANKDIHYYAKVCMLADIYDALTTQRSYNKVLSKEEAVKIMSNMVGQKIDPKLFEKFQGYMKVFIPKEKNKRVLSSQFDPSVPFKELEFEEKITPENKKGNDFGSIIKKAV